jgi:hypothetical protein
MSCMIPKSILVYSSAANAKSFFLIYCKKIFLLLEIDGYASDLRFMYPHLILYLEIDQSTLHLQTIADITPLFLLRVSKHFFPESIES